MVAKVLDAAFCLVDKSHGAQITNTTKPLGLGTNNN